MGFQSEPPKTYQVTPYRWVIVSVFGLYALTNCFQWMCFSPINDKISSFYNVRPATVDWLSMVFMIVYIPLIFPVTWLLDRKGLRLTAYIGAFTNVLGAAVKCFSPYSGRFAVLMTGQTVCAISQVFILGLPPRVAAVWFAEHEVPTATGIGVFAIQLGMGLAFLVPLAVPSVVTVNGNLTDSTTPETEIYEANLALLYNIKVGVTAAVFIITLLTMREKPEHPPSPAQEAISKDPSHASYVQWMRILLRNWDFNALALTFGIMIGALNALSTLLTQLVLAYFPGEFENAGYIGMTMVLSGLPGSVLLGIYLSYCRKFKETTFWTYAVSSLSVLVFMLVLHYSNGVIWPLFLVGFFVGFFMTGYITVSYELAAEITYPAAEGTTSGLLNVSVQIISLALTGIMGEILARYSSLAAQGLLIAAVFLGTVITFFIKADLKRSRAARLDKNKSDGSLGTPSANSTQLMFISQAFAKCEKDPESSRARSETDQI